MRAGACERSRYPSFRSSLYSCFPQSPSGRERKHSAPFPGTGILSHSGLPRSGSQMPLGISYWRMLAHWSLSLEESWTFRATGKRQPISREATDFRNILTGIHPSSNAHWLCDLGQVTYLSQLPFPPLEKPDRVVGMMK